MTDKEREYFYYAVSDAMTEFYKAVKLIAKITVGRLGLVQAAYAPELWLAAHQETIMLAYDLSQHDCLSQREAKMAALREAAQWLANYGGSWQRRDRGLDEIEQRLKLLRREDSGPAENVKETGETDNEHRT